MIFGQHKFGCHDVFAQRPYMLIRRYRRANFQRGGVNLFDHLDHNDGVEIGRHRIARVNPYGLPAHREAQRRCFGCPHGVRGAHRDAVHRRRIVVRRRHARPHRRGRNPPSRPLDRYRFSRHRRQTAHALQRRKELAQRIVKRYITEVVSSAAAV